jgi:hypothetical protein
VAVYNFLRGEEFLEFFPEPLPLKPLIGVTIEALDYADRFYIGVVFAEPLIGDLEISSPESAGSVSSLTLFYSSLSLGASLDSWTAFFHNFFFDCISNIFNITN